MITTSEATQSGAITYTAGGGIYNAGNMYLLNSSISKTSIGNTKIYGSAIENTGNMTLNKTIIHNITGYRAIHNDETGNLLITNSIIKNNKIYSIKNYANKVFYGAIENSGILNN